MQMLRCLSEGAEAPKEWYDTNSVAVDAMSMKIYYAFRGFSKCLTLLSGRKGVCEIPLHLLVFRISLYNSVKKPMIVTNTFEICFKLHVLSA
jgi:hypothetical protein